MKKTIRRLLGVLILFTLSSFFFSLYYWTDENIPDSYAMCFLAGWITTMCIVFIIFTAWFALDLIFKT